MGKPAAPQANTTAVRRHGFKFRRGGGGGGVGGGRAVGPVKTIAFRPNPKAIERASVYNRKWLESVDKARESFSDEALTTTFGKENVEKLVNACKMATESEVSESNRLLTDDYVYSVQITSHRAPHVPVHLSRM